ncbi:acetylornithine deacetylase [Chelatococcus reniformis]|nr:acetylornithine deacetylase [Chelatococcus reniformis]
MAGPRYTPLAMLERLVAFPTESTTSNLALIDFVEDYLRAWGVPATRIPNAAGDKAALFATVGPAGDGGIVLSGHTDVVPVAGQVWTSDPYALRVADGRAFGRGAVDMKGFVATALALVPDFLAAPLAIPIHLFLSYDEEITCLGVVDGIARMGRDLPTPAMAIVGEPTCLAVTDAHKSVVSLRTTVVGQAGHSSRPAAGASAVMAAGELIAELVRMQERLIEEGDPSHRFDPPYSTVHVGVVSGGVARNILAPQCQFLWEFRGLPGRTHEAVMAEFDQFATDVVLRRMRRGAPGAAIETICEVAVPHLSPRPGSPAEVLALRLVDSNRTITVPYATEAGHFQDAGIPTVVCGPGSIDQAHQADEFISLADLDAGERFLRRLAHEISRP